MHTNKQTNPTPQKKEAQKKMQRQSLFDADAVLSASEM